MTKRTNWLPGHITPVRYGVYERKYPPLGAVLLCYYGPRGWAGGCFDADEAEACKDLISLRQMLPWRGLAEKPKGSK